MRILFDSKDEKFKKPFGTLVPGQSCRFTVYVPTEISPVGCALVLENENGDKAGRFESRFDGKYGAYDRFTVVMIPDRPGLFFYYFRIRTAREDFALYREGWNDTNMEAGEKWQLSVIPADFRTPEALYGSVMYQIFPDRFARKGLCDTSGKLKPFHLHDSPDDIPEWEPDESGEVTNCDFFGGNLAGIADKLDYLASIGVKIVYLNPIFKAWSNHRYDTADYKKIDELLGTEEDFRNLCDQAHKRDMKIILDGVFSHTGSRSVYFDEKGEFGHGAVSDPESPYRDWFDFKKFPDDYTAWWGVKTLPCVHELNESYRRFIISGEDSVIAHWLHAGADGFRLDVADELPDAFIRELRERLKEINPNALLIGEVWEDASNKISYGVRRTYFTGGELDSVMNYPFKEAVLAFVTGQDDGTAFRNTVMTVAENYPSQVLHLLMNMLSTHDTCRVLSLLSPSPAPREKRERAAYRLSKEDFAIAEERLKAAAFLQFVLPGMPCVFYGDEIGTEGFEDPFCRSYFRWDRVEGSTLLSFFKELSRVRRDSKALTYGDVRVDTDAGGRVWIRRAYGDTSVCAVLNAGNSAEISLPGKILFSHKAVCSERVITLEQYGFALVQDI